MLVYINGCFWHANITLICCSFWVSSLTTLIKKKKPKFFELNSFSVNWIFDVNTRRTFAYMRALGLLRRES